MLRQRDPRVVDPAFKGWVARLPCLACMALGREHKLRKRRGVQVAHVRMGDLEAGWRETGMAEKPSDYRVVPLCVDHHTNGPEAQHNVGEEPFWEWLGLRPFDVCSDLVAAYEAGRDGAFVIARWAAKSTVQGTVL